MQKSLIVCLKNISSVYYNITFVGMLSKQVLLDPERLYKNKNAKSVEICYKINFFVKNILNL